MTTLPCFRWLTITTTALPASPNALPWADSGRIPSRASFTTPPDPCWANYHGVVTTARPSAVAFR